MREHHRELIRELTAVGLRPRLRRTPGDHYRIEWEQWGKSYFILTASTPSDYRAVRNARARMRRLLRSAKQRAVL